MIITKEETLKEKRSFEENTSLGKMQDRITELELRVEELENDKRIN